MDKRYKQLMYFPGATSDPGDVFIISDGKTYKVPSDMTTSGFKVNLDPSGYAHLFREMNWWEERPLEHMPRYVRTVKGIFGYYREGDVLEVTAWGLHTPEEWKDLQERFVSRWFAYAHGAFASDHELEVQWLEPATKEDYIKFWDRKQTK